MPISIDSASEVNSLSGVQHLDLVWVSLINDLETVYFTPVV